MDKETALTARAIAAEILDAVLSRRQSLDIELATHTGIRQLDRRDRAFLRNLLATTLRRLGQIDALINHCLKRPLPKNAGAVRQILRLGVCQMFFLEVADHAAVSTAVELVRSGGHTAHVKLVNAVLRRLGREGVNLMAAQDAAHMNTPGWLWESWGEAFGSETGRRIAEAHLHEAPLDISVCSRPDHWAAELDATILPSGTLRRLSGGIVSSLPGYAEGTWWVQDTAARMVAALLGDVRGKRVVDLCAAPGGKTAFLAAEGALVTAVDRSDKRLDRLRENLQRLNLDAEVITADATLWRPSELVDAVLVDAPCSATGTIRRHPDIPWNKSQKDVDALAKTQTRLLAAAAEMLKPGGTLVYATCSLQKEEGDMQIEKFLSATDRFVHERLQPQDVFHMDAVIDSAGMFRSLPHHLPQAGGIDGFFAARLRCR